MDRSPAMSEKLFHARGQNEKSRKPKHNRTAFSTGVACSEFNCKEDDACLTHPREGGSPLRVDGRQSRMQSQSEIAAVMGRLNPDQKAESAPARGTANNGVHVTMELSTRGILRNSALKAARVSGMVVAKRAALPTTRTDVRPAPSCKNTKNTPRPPACTLWHSRYPFCPREGSL